MNRRRSVLKCVRTFRSHERYQLLDKEWVALGKRHDASSRFVRKARRGWQILQKHLGLHGRKR